MKTQIIAGMVGMIMLAACGTEQTVTSSTKEPAIAFNKQVAVIEEITKIEATNGGFNPQYAAFRVEGRIMTGSNRCSSEGVRVDLEQQRIGNKEVLVGVRYSPIRPRVACTREFMPQYATFSKIVRYNNAATADVVLKNFKSMGNDISASQLLVNNQLSREAVLSAVKVNQTNGGINPTHRGLVVSGTVELGGNRCTAAGATAQLVSERVGSTVYVKAVVQQSPDSFRRICTMEYMPVYATVTTSLMFDGRTTSAVVIKNVEKLGQNRSAFDFVSSRR